MTARTVLVATAARQVLAIAARAAAELAGLGLTATAAWLITRASQRPGIAALSLAIVGVRAFAILRGTLCYGERLSGHETALRASLELRGRLYEALVRLLPGWTHRAHGGDLLAQMVGDVEVLQELILRVWTPAALQVLAGGGAILLCCLLWPAAGVELAVGVGVSALLLPVAAGLWFRRLAGRRIEATSDLAAQTVDLLQGAADLAAFGATDQALAAANEIGGRLARLERATAYRYGVVEAGRLAIGGLTVISVTVSAVGATGTGRLPPILVPVLALTTLAAMEIPSPLPAAALRFVQSVPSLRRLSTVLSATPPVREPTCATPVPAPPLELAVENLRVRHRPGSPLALDGVRLRIRQGERVALVGASGSGKTTLLSALMRFVAIESGQVSLNGLGLEAFRGDDVRRLMTGVIEHAHLFSATLAENLRLANPDATDQDLARAADQARLLEWVESLPEGWRTMAGEDGSRLSGGQRQRLLLAQALLANPPILLLDEPTEGLDRATADAVLRDLLSAAGTRSVVIATHRLTGLETMDQIVVLDQGHMIQRGRHRELVAAPGYYREAWLSEQLAS